MECDRFAVVYAEGVSVHSPGSRSAPWVREYPMIQTPKGFHILPNNFWSDFTSDANVGELPEFVNRRCVSPVTSMSIRR